MSKMRRRHAPEFKLRAVVEILKGEKTAAQLAGELEVHPLVLSEWKKHFFEHGAQIFERGTTIFYQMLGYQKDFERKGYARGSKLIFLSKDLH